MAWPFGEGSKCQRCFGGLASVKSGELDTCPAIGEAAGENIEGDVRRVFLMMAERGDRVFAR